MVEGDLEVMITTETDSREINIIVEVSRSNNTSELNNKEIQTTHSNTKYLLKSLPLSMQ